MEKLNRPRRKLLIVGILFLLTMIALAVVYFKTQTHDIVNAVRATLPRFCVSGNIVVYDNGESWEVACDKDAPFVGAAMNINKATCQIDKPINMSLEWSEAYQTLFTPGQKLAFCPGRSP